jgi:ribonuclease HI
MNQQTTPILYFDGGSRGNPGIAAGAAVLQLPDAEPYIVSEFMKHATNNEAEYTGLVIGLKKAQQLGIKTLEVRGDSQLVINQVNGLWNVKSDNLSGLYNQARRLMVQFNQIQISWVPRKENYLADIAVNDCIDRAMGKDGASSLPKNPNLSSSRPKSLEPDLFNEGDLIVISQQKNRDKPRAGIVVEPPEISDNGIMRMVIEISTKD